MTIKKCTCGENITTKNATKIMRDDLGMYAACPNCKSTAFVRDKNFKRELLDGSEEAFYWYSVEVNSYAGQQE